MLFYLHQFWKMFQIKLANKKLYKASIDRMRLRLAELKKSDNEA